MQNMHIRFVIENESFIRKYNFNAHAIRLCEFHDINHQLGKLEEFLNISRSAAGAKIFSLLLCVLFCIPNEYTT